MPFNIAPGDKKSVKLYLYPSLTMQTSWNCSWGSQSIVLIGQPLVRFGIDNIISSFKKHDESTCQNIE